MVFNSINKMRTSCPLGWLCICFFFLLKFFLKHAIDMKNESFIFLTITYEINNFKC